MHQFFADFGAFLSAVGAHLLTLLTGCVVTVVIGIIEKHFNQKLSWKQDLSVLVFFLFFACFQAWRDKNSEYDGEKARHTTDQLYAQIQYGTLQSGFNELRGQCQFKDGQLSTLSQQNRDQQNTINHCQEKALSLLTPAARDVTILPFRNEQRAPGFNERSWLLLVNQNVTPIRMFVACDSAITEGSVGVVGNATSEGNQAYTPNRNSFGAALASVWNPKSPLIVSVNYSTGYPDCSFRID